MRGLLDTHALLWYLAGDPRLSLTARAFMDADENDLLVSVASLWEIVIKLSLGKLSLGAPFERLFPEQLHRNRIEILGITLDHLNRLGTLPFHHRDPFDRLLVAQAITDRVPVISADPVLDAYAVTRIW